MSGHDQDELRRQVTRLKNCDAAKFKTLCHMHLSFLLDLDGASFEDFLNEDQPDCKKKSHNFRHFGRKKSKGDRTDMMQPQLTVQSINNIELLVRYLSRPENLRLEGLFRKSGQLSRQRTLRDRMDMGESLESELATGIYTGHDCANLLKALLGELPEPLLTERHFSIYLKVPDMIQPSMSPTDLDLMAERQVATAQLLLQLLPRDNVRLLKSVVSLLHKVALMEGNLMTSETLGTMFAPHILVPRRMSASELQQITTLTTRAVAFLIDHAPELFKVPQPLMRDISAYWQEMEEAMDSRRHQEEEITMRSCQHKCKKSVDTDELRTTVTFVDRKAMQRPNVQTDTQVELAQLYAHISTMPESAKKRKLLKQFNRANGVGTPLPSSKHKRSKSLSESIKKMVGRSNHKRRGSGNSVHVAESSVPAPKPQAFTAVSPPTIIQHTPIIKSMTGKSAAMTVSSNSSTSSSPATFASPVVRLFKENMDQPILPSSPCVHIVDLKAADPVIVNTRKRKIDSSPAFCTPQPLSSIYRQSRKQQLVENYENIAPTPNFNRWTQKNEKSPHADAVVSTPDRRFEKASSCISPITRSMANAPRHVKVKTSPVLRQFFEFCV